MDKQEELKQRAVNHVQKIISPDNQAWGFSLAHEIINLHEVHAHFKALYSQSVPETAEHTDMMVICYRWLECPYHEGTCPHRAEHVKGIGCTALQMDPCPVCVPVATETKRVCSQPQ